MFEWLRRKFRSLNSNCKLRKEFQFVHAGYKECVNVVYCILGHAETAHNRIASVVLGFKEALLEEAEKRKDTRK